MPRVWSIFATGIPVQRETTLAMSSSSTSSFSIRSCPSRAPECRLLAPSVPSPVRPTSRSESPPPCPGLPRARPFPPPAARPRSAPSGRGCAGCWSSPAPSGCAARARRFSSSATSASSRSRRSSVSGSVSRFMASRSMANWRILRSTSSSSTGRLSISIRSMLAASSTRSMALSGRNRSVMYRCDSVAAATRAASRMRTPWWTSYRSRSPRRIEMVSSTLGWRTTMGWKRRSSAASFSIRFRYSSSVVAPDAAKLAAGQRRLQHVAGVDRPLGGARADQGVQLVDEEDDPSRRLGRPP